MLVARYWTDSDIRLKPLIYKYNLTLMTGQNLPPGFTACWSSQSKTASGHQCFHVSLLAVSFYSAGISGPTVRASQVRKNKTQRTGSVWNRTWNRFGVESALWELLSSPLSCKWSERASVSRKDGRLRPHRALCSTLQTHTHTNTHTPAHKHTHRGEPSSCSETLAEPAEWEGSSRGRSSCKHIKTWTPAARLLWRSWLLNKPLNHLCQMEGSEERESGRGGAISLAGKKPWYLYYFHGENLESNPRLPRGAWLTLLSCLQFQIDFWVSLPWNMHVRGRLLEKEAEREAGDRSGKERQKKQQLYSLLHFNEVQK